MTPGTILRRHRERVSRKWDYSRRRQKFGRPAVVREIVELLLRMAREDPTWGYDRLQGALANLGHKISDSTVAKILREHGIEPAPERKRQATWHAFQKAHWDVLASIDFTTIEIRTRGGLITFYLLFVLELATRPPFGGFPEATGSAGGDSLETAALWTQSASCYDRLRLELMAI